MNKYGAQAMRHWEQYLPKRLAEIPIEDREAFFNNLGNETQSEINALADAIAGPDRPGETYMEKVGRLNMARFSAESDLIRELVLIDPENEQDDGPVDQELLDARAQFQAQREADSRLQEELDELADREQIKWDLEDQQRLAAESAERPGTSAG